MGVLMPRFGGEWWIDIHPGALAPGREPGGSPCAAKRLPLFLPGLCRRDGGDRWAGAAEVCSSRGGAREGRGKGAPA